MVSPIPFAPYGRFAFSDHLLRCLLRQVYGQHSLRYAPRCLQTGHV